ncbi:MAG: tail assembly protein, partial [Gammaproteobacteria bacterium]|nr:tail assembly protein [Gammaproteobacteria bacterium]
MATIRLYGDLQDYGKRFDFDIKTAGEGLRALFTQIDGLQKRISEGGYFVRVAKKDVTDKTIEKDMARELTDKDVIHIVPEIMGAGKFGSIVLGAVLIGAAFFTGGLSLAGTGMFGIANTTIAMAGLGLVMGGVAQMLAPQPKFGETKNT